MRGHLGQVVWPCGLFWFAGSPRERANLRMLGSGKKENPTCKCFPGITSVGGRWKA